MELVNKLEVAINDNKRRENLEKRLWSKIKVGGKDDCWEWQRKEASKKGYGLISSGRSAKFKAHRVAYALTFGVISNDMLVLHKCDNPKCCNPNHLFLGTAKDNTDDCIKKNRKTDPPHSYGESHHNAKFSKEQALMIKGDNRSVSQIAKDYGVCTQTIRRLKKNETWKQL